MTKANFLDLLSDRLSSLPQNEVLKYTNYYSEQIEDRKDEGMTEAQAIEDLENIEVITKEILEDYRQGGTQFQSNTNTGYTPTQQYDQQNQQQNEAKKQSNERLALKIILIIVTFPIWISVLSTIFGLYVAAWSIIFALFAAVLALGIAAVCVLCASFFAIGQGLPAIFVMVGGSIILAGLAILLCIGAVYASIGLAKLTAAGCKAIARFFTGKKTQKI